MFLNDVLRATMGVAMGIGGAERPQHEPMRHQPPHHYEQRFNARERDNDANNHFQPRQRDLAVEVIREELQGRRGEVNDLYRQLQNRDAEIRRLEGIVAALQAFSLDRFIALKLAQQRRDPLQNIFNMPADQLNEYLQRHNVQVNEEIWNVLQRMQ